MTSETTMMDVVPPSALAMEMQDQSLTESQSALNESLGIIIPPPDIRSIINKTAQFVAKNGPEFEQRVVLDKGSERKFSFLLPDNPYKPYYDAKVREYSTGDVSEAAKPQVPQAIVELKKREAEKQKKKESLLALTSYATEPSFYSVEETPTGLLKLTNFAQHAQKDPRLLAIEDGRPPEAVPEMKYTAQRPFAAALDIDVIKLTAQFVTRNGQRFLVGLTQRERGNTQFAFLRATHPLFPYFTSLVDAYTRCLMPDKAVLNQLKEDIGISGRFNSAADNQAIDLSAKLMDVSNPKSIQPNQMNALLGIFDRVIARYRWEEYEERKKQEKAREDAEEREQMHALDWHDFIVVEIIQFTEEDETLPLMPPIELSQLTQPRMISPLAATPATEPMRVSQTLIPPQVGGTAMQSGLQTVEGSAGGEPIQAVGATSSMVASTRPLLTTMPPLQQQDGFSDAPPEVSNPAAVSMVVVSDYVRQPKKRNRQAEKMLKCPITGQWIPAEQMTEHLRILLLDPKWKGEKDALLAKASKDGAFSLEADFESNLANFVVMRPDLFGSVDDECESAYVPVPKR